MKIFIHIAVIFAAFSHMAYGFTPGFETHYEVKSKTGKCLDVAGSNKNNNAIIQVYNCTGRTNQRWYFTAIASTTYSITSLNSDRCLDINSHKVNQKGIPVLQWGCHHGSNQLWLLEQQGDGSHLIRSVASNFCLDINGTNNTVQQYPCHGGENQKWYITDPKEIDSHFQSGDLQILDWCYSYDSDVITIYPIIRNAGDKKWFSKQEGTISFSVRFAPSIHHNKHTKIPSYPHMVLTPDSTNRLTGTKLLKGNELAMGFSGFELDHPDDSNKTNNRIDVREYEIYKRVRDGELAKKKCR